MVIEPGFPLTLYQKGLRLHVKAVSKVYSRKFKYLLNIIYVELLNLNSLIKDTANILGAENLDLLSPLIALEHREAFPVVRAFLSHILTQFKMVS